MKKVFHVLMVLLLAALPCSSQEKVLKRVSVLQHPYYAPYVLPALKGLVAKRGKAKRNHFYVSKVKVFEGGYHSVLVYWTENRALVLWEPGRGHNRLGEPDPKYDLANSRRYWELDKDVVPSLDDVGGSSFLTTRRDAREWVRDCVRYGVRHVINR